MRYLLFLMLFSILIADSVNAQNFQVPESNPLSTFAIFDDVNSELLSERFRDLNPMEESIKFKMPIFNPKDVDAKILIGRPSEEYRYNMPNMLPKDKNGKAFKFDRDRKKD